MANQPWMLILQGLVMAVLYYLVFSFMIDKFDIATPGRKGPVDGLSNNQDEAQVTKGVPHKMSKEERQAAVIYEAVGGKDNLKVVNNCSTRLRLQLEDTSKVDQAKLKSAGAMGVNVIDKENLQVIIGTTVQQVADALED